MERNFKLLSPVLCEVYGDYAIWCPHCQSLHRFPSKGSETWNFNGALNEPSFSPSMLIYTTRPDKKNPKKSVRVTLCHFHVIDGKLRFCKDTPHGWAGKVVPLPNIPHDA